MNQSPWIEVPKHTGGIYRASVLAQDWKQSFLYEGSRPNRILLSYDEIPGRDDQLIAVLGPLGYTSLKKFLTEEVLD